MSVRKKKKKKQGSLAAIWEKISEIASLYGDGKDGKDESDAELVRLADEMNGSNLPSMIVENFVKPYIQDKKMRVVFVPHTQDDSDGWGVEFSKESSEFRINPLGLHRLYATVSKSEQAALPPDEDDFEKRRMAAFNVEMVKLPGPYFMFIAILSNISMICQVFTAEKRGGKKIVPDGLSLESYFPLLWALKQFESFYRRVQNRDIRSDFGIIWHESEWIDNKK